MMCWFFINMLHTKYAEKNNYKLMIYSVNTDIK